MSKTDSEVVIPITNTGRKYGYIIWHAKRDDEVKAIFGDKKSIDLHFEDFLQENKRIDWVKRRVSISGSLTRSLPQNARNIRLKRKGQRVFVAFE